MHVDSICFYLEIVRTTKIKTNNRYGVWKLLQPAVRKTLDLCFGNQMATPGDLHHLSGPRILKTHLTFNLLHPDLLETSKVT